MDTHDLLSEARAYIQAGEHHEADQIIREVLRQQPDNLVAWRLAERNTRDPEQLAKIRMRIDRILDEQPTYGQPAHKSKRMPGTDPYSHRPKAKNGQPVRLVKRDRGVFAPLFVFAGMLFMCCGVFFIPIGMGSYNFTFRVNEDVVFSAVGENTRATLSARAQESFFSGDQAGWLPAGVYLAGDINAPGTSLHTHGNNTTGYAGWVFTLRPGESADISVMPSSPFIDRVTLYLFRKTTADGAQLVDMLTREYDGRSPLDDTSATQISVMNPAGGEYVVVVEIAEGTGYTIQLMRAVR